MQHSSNANAVMCKSASLQNPPQTIRFTKPCNREKDYFSVIKDDKVQGELINIKVPGHNIDTAE